MVLRFGIALPMSVNLPFRQIAAAGLKLHADGSGDIPLALADAQRVAYAVPRPGDAPALAAAAAPPPPPPPPPPRRRPAYKGHSTA